VAGLPPVKQRKQASALQKVKIEELNWHEVCFFLEEFVSVSDRAVSIFKATIDRFIERVLKWVHPDDSAKRIGFMRKRLILCISLTASLVFAQYSGDKQAYFQAHRSEMNRLAANILANPKDVQSLQNLSIILLDLQDCKKANQLLRKAFLLDSTDSKTLFYYGLALEGINDKNRALAVYNKYAEVPDGSPFRSKMRAKSETLETELSTAAAENPAPEEPVQAAPKIFPQAIAVFPLKYLGKDPEYASLGRGLSEMVITDLSQVKKLILIERVRLQAILDEIRLSNAGMTDPLTVPKRGRQLGAGRILWGEYDVTDGGKMTMKLSMVDALNPNLTPVKAGQADALDKIFDMEKRIVFGVLKSMRVELTQEEKERVLRVPTRNVRAFMDYCAGLEKQDNGKFAEAAESFKSALKLDPGFRDAAAKSNANSKTI
jgi:TolB-like protein